MYRASVFALCGGLTLPIVARTQVPSAVVFRNVTVVPMDSERVVPAQTVVIRGSAIESVAPAAHFRVPPHCAWLKCRVGRCSPQIGGRQVVPQHRELSMLAWFVVAAMRFGELQVVLRDTTPTLGRVWSSSAVDSSASVIARFMNSRS